MSDDLIKRSDAIEAIEMVDWYHQASRNKDMVNGANPDEHQAWYKADDIYKALEAVPSADRPQGEWMIEIDVNGNTYGRCSICGMRQYAGQLNYCPNCGAKMKGADDEVDTSK